MNLKKKDDRSMDASVLLRRGNKILTGGNMGTKCEAETEGKTIQRLPHMGIHPIIKPPNADTLAYANKILLKGA